MSNSQFLFPCNSDILEIARPQRGWGYDVVEEIKTAKFLLTIQLHRYQLTSIQMPTLNSLPDASLDLPKQCVSFPVKPSRHGQLKEPWLFTHARPGGHALFCSHSSTSVKVNRCHAKGRFKVSSLDVGRSANTLLMVVGFNPP